MLIPIRDETTRLKTTVIAAVSVSLLCLIICRGESPREQRLISAFVGLSATIIGTPPMFLLWQTRAARIVEREGLRKWQAMTTGQKWGQRIQKDLIKMGQLPSQVDPCGNGIDCGCTQTEPQRNPNGNDWEYQRQDEWQSPQVGGLKVQYLDPVALKKQNTGLLVCGSSGSAKTTMIRYCLPTWIDEGYQVIVLDPHADPTHPEYPWGDFPYVVGEHDQIFLQIKILMDLLKKKDRQKVICICDEWTDLLGFATLEDKQNKTNYFNLLQSFIVRWGTGGRKFNKFLIGIGHTDNVKMWGLEGIGGLLRNYGILRLGDIAVRYGEMQGHNSPLAVYSKQTAYPLLINEQPTIHPTHGHYRVKENEQPPANLRPLNFHKLGFEFVGNDVRVERSNVHSEKTHTKKDADTDTNPTQWLNHLYSLDSSYVDTQTHRHNQASNTCPECGSTNTKGNGTYKEKPRRRCKSCGKSWTQQP